MCIITLEDESGTVDVNKTNIFARNTRPGFQIIVYSMSIKTNSRAAMILPIPVTDGAGMVQ